MGDLNLWFNEAREFEVHCIMNNFSWSHATGWITRKTSNLDHLEKSEALFNSLLQFVFKGEYSAAVRASGVMKVWLAIVCGVKEGK